MIALKRRWAGPEPEREGGASLLEETRSMKLTLTTQVLQKLLGSVAKETHYFIILCKFVEEKLACLKQLPWERPCLVCSRPWIQSPAPPKINFKKRFCFLGSRSVDRVVA